MNWMSHTSCSVNGHKLLAIAGEQRRVEFLGQRHGKTVGKRNPAMHRLQRAGRVPQFPVHVVPLNNSGKSYISQSPHCFSKSAGAVEIVEHFAQIYRMGETFITLVLQGQRNR
jgi:hypothetical protein